MPTPRLQGIEAHHENQHNGHAALAATSFHSHSANLRHTPCTRIARLPDVTHHGMSSAKCPDRKPAHTSSKHTYRRTAHAQDIQVANDRHRIATATLKHTAASITKHRTWEQTGPHDPGTKPVAFTNAKSFRSDRLPLQRSVTSTVVPSISTQSTHFSHKCHSAVAQSNTLPLYIGPMHGVARPIHQPRFRDGRQGSPKTYARVQALLNGPPPHAHGDQQPTNVNPQPQQRHQQRVVIQMWSEYPCITQVP
jgi:hypothetical protein